MSIAYISLGSNIGNKLENLQKAIFKIGEIKNTVVIAVSSFYKTAPVGYTDQDWFLNAVAKVECDMSPQELLHNLLSIESQLGRVRTIRWGPRVIDLDLLLYDKFVINEQDLTLPHPRISERAFVMVPMLEITPELELPTGVKLSRLLNDLKYENEVFKISEN